MGSGKIRHDCPYCKKPFTPEEMVERIKRKADNARSSRLKALANGNRVVRKRRIAYEDIVHLRRVGKSPNEIAEMHSVSVSTVYRRLKYK